VLDLLEKMLHPERTKRFPNWEEFLGAMARIRI